MLSVRVLVLTAALAALQVPLRINVVDYPRPVSQAVREVERYFGFVVTYEDHLYVHPGDIVDITAQVRRDGDLSKKVLGMRRGSIALTHAPQPGPVTGEVEAVLLRVVEASRRAGNTGDFRVECDAIGCHVIPTAIRGKSGRREPYMPLLDTLIALPGGSFRGFEFLEAVQSAVRRASGRDLALGIRPTNLLVRREFLVEDLRGTARDVLWRGLRALDPRLSWQLLCDAGERASCALNLHLTEVKVAVVHPGSCVVEPALAACGNSPRGEFSQLFQQAIDAKERRNCGDRHGCRTIRARNCDTQEQRPDVRRPSARSLPLEIRSFAWI